MKINKILNQYRRDFTAEIECESCGNKETLRTGYDDRFYHDKVMPAIICKKCGKSRNNLGITGDFYETKYPEGMVI